MERLSRIALVLAYGIACLLVGWTLNGKYGVEKNIKDRVPSIQEIQQLVGCEKIDGKIGPDTITKWNAAICQQEANRWFVKQ